MSNEPVATKPKDPWWIAFVCGMASYIDAAAIVSSGIALVIYQHTIGIDAVQIGILSAALTFCIAIGAIVGGRLGDQFGRRAVFIVTMGMIAIGATLQVFSGTFEPLLIGTILVGLGTGADLPVSLATIAEASTDDNRGKMIGFSGQLWLGGIVGSIIISTIVGNWGRVGGQILYGQVLVAALATLVMRLSIPESESWKAARDERAHGVQTIRADRASVRDLLRAPYAKPFIALLFFYALTNLGANTGGQFGTYLSVNVIGLDVAFASMLGLVFIPFGFLFGWWFMRIADTPKRFAYFKFGAVMMILQYLIPVVVGFSLPQLIVCNMLAGLGSAFAFEGIMKVWTQESFPTLLRTTAQGSIVAVARFLAAALATVTPLAINAGPRVLYAGLAVVCAIGLAFAYWGFKDQTRNEFDVETQLDPEAVPNPGTTV